MSPERGPTVRITRDAAAAGALAADLLAQAAREAVAARGRFHLAIPGGSSPRTVFAALALPPHHGDFPWDRTDLLWVDERAVLTDHPDSNYGAFARDTLPGLPLDPARLHRMRGELGPHAGAMDYRQTLFSTLGPGGVLDAALLGIGEDGHIASLFPGSPALAAQDRVIGITDSPKPPPARITLTLPVLRSARLIILLGLGRAKADAVARCLAGEPLPAGMAASGGNAVFVLDEQASRR